MDTKNMTVVELARLGGKSAWAKDRAKMVKAVQANGRKGGRPKTKLVIRTG